MKQRCQSNYERETTEQGYHFLKQQIAYYNTPSQSFERSPIARCSLIDSTEDPGVRQELFKQYKEIAKQSRTALFNAYLKSAEDQRAEYKEKYDNTVKRSPTNYHEKPTPMMSQLINERCDKINERVQCIYRFKLHSFLSAAQP